MAVIAIEMLKEHRFQENARSTRVIPRKWCGEIDEEAAVIAIGSGAARARQELNDEQKLAVEVFQAAEAKNYDRLRELGILPPLEAPAGDAAATAAAAAAALVKN